MYVQMEALVYRMRSAHEELLRKAVALMLIVVEHRLVLTLVGFWHCVVHHGIRKRASVLCIACKLVALQSIVSIKAQYSSKSPTACLLTF